MSGIPLGYVPYLRPGALIFTAIAWRHLLMGGISEKKSVEEVYGHIGGRKRNLFGERVQFASKALFGKDKSPEEVLLRHTLFGVYSRALPQRAADAWAKALVDGDIGSQVRGRMRVAVARGFRFITADLRSCKTCVTQDMDEFGFPSWYVLHVLPPVHHCPAHGDALTTEIKGNVGGNMWNLRLPTGASIKNSDRRFESASDGYVAYLRLWKDLFEGGLLTIAADAWAHYIDLVTERMGGTENAIGELHEQLAQSWNSPPDRLHDVLGTHIQHDFLRNELEHRSAPGRIAQKLVILTACDALGILPDRGSLPEQMNMPLGSCKHIGQLQAREQLLRDALLHAGFPLAIAPGLASSLSTWEISKSTGVHRHLVQKAIKSFSASTLDELRVLPSWSKDSWLQKEMLRRRRTNAY